MPPPIKPEQERFEDGVVWVYYRQEDRPAPDQKENHPKGHGKGSGKRNWNGKLVKEWACAPLSLDGKTLLRDTLHAAYGFQNKNQAKAKCSQIRRNLEKQGGGH